MRRAAKVDSNHGVIRDAFRSMGCSVADTFQLGGGFPDMVVAISGVNVLVEVKDGDKPPSARRLTKDEQEFRDGWGGPYEIVETIEDAHRLVNEMRQRARA